MPVKRNKSVFHSVGRNWRGNALPPLCMENGHIKEPLRYVHMVMSRLKLDSYRREGKHEELTTDLSKLSSIIYREVLSGRDLDKTRKTYEALETLAKELNNDD